MSIIFGLRNVAMDRVSLGEMHGLAAATERYASDPTFFLLAHPLGMGFQPYHTHERSQMGEQPLIDDLGNVLAFDGRLDNWKALGDTLGVGDRQVSDAQIVLAAFRRWGRDSFSALIGDWALSLWSAPDQELYLARDHAGTRTLYFGHKNGSFLWSTHLDTFFTEGSAFELDQAYAARYLNNQTLGDLTPYQGIRSVLPAHYVVVTHRGIVSTMHWNPEVPGPIHYNADQEYEDHFLDVFRQAVGRRTGQGAPILAHLSGGMDSTSIVCVSDQIRRAESCEPALLDTISFYDDSEPSWNEKPYFAAVEAARGKTGIHVDTSHVARTFEPADPSQGQYFLPGTHSGSRSNEVKFCDLIRSYDYRIILAGHGGDEVLGGVPTPYPELADYLHSGQLKQLAMQTTAWSLSTRKPVPHILYDTISHLVGVYRIAPANRKRIPAWLSPQLKQHCLEPDIATTLNSRKLAIRPSAIDRANTWWPLIETLPHLYPGVVVRHEYRYPYLDRDVVEFLNRIPARQLVEPGKRRSLMRRSLKHIVPSTVLDRRRKGCVTRSPFSSFQCAEQQVDQLFTGSLTAAHGLIDSIQFRTTYQQTIRSNDPSWFRTLMRTIEFELWLRSSVSYISPVGPISRKDKIMLPVLGRRQVPCDSGS